MHRLIQPQRMGKSNDGFSILELLICVAIIAILLAFYSGALSKAFRAAKATAGAEGMRQENISRYAEGSPEWKAAKLRDYARNRFRKVIDTGKQDSIITELIFKVDNDDQMKAYWHTLLNPNNEEPLEFHGDGRLAAYDSEGNGHYLTRIDEPDKRPSGYYPVMWQFLSTSTSEMGTTSLTFDVLYNDGHIDKVRYPGSFPATKTVAEFGHLFLLYQGQ
jgi:prepilin-type N-terminal cleavage/methylation domain-containing protein